MTPHFAESCGRQLQPWPRETCGKPSWNPGLLSAPALTGEELPVSQTPQSSPAPRHPELSQEGAQGAGSGEAAAAPAAHGGSAGSGTGARGHNRGPDTAWTSHGVNLGSAPLRQAEHALRSITSSNYLKAIPSALGVLNALSCSDHNTESAAHRFQRSPGLLQAIHYRGNQMFTSC